MAQNSADMVCHDGMNYIDFLSELTEKRSIKRYIEIGVRSGELFSNVHAEFAIAVDKRFDISSNIAKNKKVVHLYQEASDDFFSRKNINSVLEGFPQIVFLDGMHVFEYLLRDFFNSEGLCDKNSLIIAHDCIPLNEEMADRDETTAKQRTIETRFHGWWTGDVWKIVPILKRYRPDLKLWLLDAAPTGLLCISNLNPNNTVLREKYFDIVSEYSMVENSWAEITKFCDPRNCISSRNVIKNFDNTLYFRI